MIRELKNLATIITKKHNLTSIDIQFKQIQQGHAYFGTRKITIPIWIFEGIKEYQYYYVIHEITHFIATEKFGSCGHSELFRKLESQILADYNIIPIYSKAYAKELHNLKGEKLCDKFGMVSKL